jgi:hypothetical protein
MVLAELKAAPRARSADTRAIEDTVRPLLDEERVRLTESLCAETITLSQVLSCCCVIKPMGSFSEVSNETLGGQNP